MSNASRMPPAFIRAFGAFVDRAAIAMGATIICLVFTNVVLHLVGQDIAWTT